MYNILFTAFPIMWFALFDQEFSKEELLETPAHFKIGLKSTDFKLLISSYRSKLWKIQVLEMDILWNMSDSSSPNYRLLFSRRWTCPI